MAVDTAISTNSTARRRLSLPLGLYGTLLPPLVAMTLLYFVPIALLSIYSIWHLESFEIVQSFSLENFRAIATNPAYRKVLVRTVAIALGVTVIDAEIAPAGLGDILTGFWLSPFGRRKALAVPA